LDDDDANNNNNNDDNRNIRFVSCIIEKDFNNSNEICPRLFKEVLSGEGLKPCYPLPMGTTA